MTNKLFATLFATFFCCATIGSAHAQSSLPLEGIWTLESVAVTKITGADTIEVAVETVKEELADMLSQTLEFRADTLILSGSDKNCGCGHHGLYERTGNQISIPFTAAPIRVEYKITDNMLYFRQQWLLGIVPPFIYQVSTVYSKQP
ncbi:MAG: hypothetical protein LBB84_03890 [Tannerellaceae bacterium]|jgi:hypothetical protein|nr:hypothetical protein [Tannerellaceae bacterium]